MLRTRLVAGVTSGVVLSAVFATALTVTNFCDALVDPWRVIPNQPAPVTLRLPRTMARAVDRETASLGAVPHGVKRGSAVDVRPLAVLGKADEKARRPPRPTHVAAQWIVYFVLILFATAYMRK